MNPAAKYVIPILGLIALLTVVTLCAVAWRTGEVATVKDVALLVIGAIAAVLAKVGFDASGGTQDVKVVNPPDDPAHVVETSSSSASSASE